MDVIVTPSNLKIHFILGAGKSGTTLLLHILNNHKNCICSPETKHLLLFYKRYHNMQEVTAELIESIEKYFVAVSDKEAVKEYQLRTRFHFTVGEKMDYFELCKRLYYISANYSTEKDNLTAIIDKNPTYTLKTDKLNKILPDAGFLCMVRDYRSFVLSNIQNKEFHAKHLPIQYHSLVWMFYNKLLLNIYNKYTYKTKFLKYEDLVSDKEKAVREVCNFFKIEYDPNCFNYHDKINLENKNLQKDKNNFLKMTSLSKPINTDRLEAWKEYFTDFQLKTIEFWCGRTGEKFGYQVSKKRNLFNSFVIFFISIPYYIRVWGYFKLKSVRLTVYLKKQRKIQYVKKLNEKMV